MKLTLQDCAGLDVTVMNVAHEQSLPGRLSINLHGHCSPVEEDGSVTIRICESPNGWGLSSISVFPIHVVEIERMPSSRIVILIK